jgi:hypothetical protein
MLKFNAPSVFMLATIAVVCLAVPAIGDIVIKKNGQVYEGEITEQTSTYLKMRTKIGGKGKWHELAFPMSAIKFVTEEDGDQAVDAASSAPALPGGEPASKSAGSADGHRVEEVIARGSGSTEREAINHALRAAVEQVVGTLITSQTQITNMRVIEDTIISFSNGFVRNYDLIGEASNLGTPQDPHFEVKLLAEVEITKIFERFRANDIEIRTSVDGPSLYGRVVTKQQRDDAAVETISGVFTGLADWLYAFEPVPGLREFDGAGFGDKVVLQRVECSIDKAGWIRLSENLNRLLDRLATGSQTLLLKSSPFTTTEHSWRGKEPFGSLQIPWPQRKRLQLMERWGPLAIDTSSSGRKLLSGETRDRTTNIDVPVAVSFKPSLLGIEDVVIIVDYDLRKATAYAVPPSLYDEISEGILQVPILDVSLLSSEGEILGRQLGGGPIGNSRDESGRGGRAGWYPFEIEDSRSGSRRNLLNIVDVWLGVWESEGRDGGRGTFFFRNLHSDYGKMYARTKKAPRTLVLYPRFHFSGFHKVFNTPVYTFDFAFEVSLEEMRQIKECRIERFSDRLTYNERGVGE